MDTSVSDNLTECNVVTVTVENRTSCAAQATRLTTGVNHWWAQFGRLPAKRLSLPSLPFTFSSLCKVFVQCCLASRGTDSCGFITSCFLFQIKIDCVFLPGSTKVFDKLRWRSYICSLLFEMYFHIRLHFPLRIMACTFLCLELSVPDV